MSTGAFDAALAAAAAFLDAREGAAALAGRVTIPPAGAIRRNLDAAQSDPTRATVRDLAASLYSWCERFEPPASPGVRATLGADAAVLDALLGLARAARDAARATP